MRQIHTIPISLAGRLGTYFAHPRGKGDFVRFRSGVYMLLFRETLLLFSLNLLDALLTIVWVRSGVATEGNLVLARLLESSDYAFLSVKLAIGTIAAVVLLRWSNVPMARYGVTAALAVYIALMGVHVITGLTAFGYITQVEIERISLWSARLFTLGA